MLSILRALFRCQHSRTTFPMTPRGRETYVCCLDCGAEMNYDWRRMKQRAQVDKSVDGKTARAVE